MIKKPAEGRFSAIGKWCGPTALAVVAGTTYRDAHRILLEAKRATTGRQNVRLMGASAKTMERGLERASVPVLHREGGLTYGLPKGDRPTLYQYLAAGRHLSTPYSPAPCWGALLLITGHYVVAYDRTLVDNRGTSALLERYKRSRVRVAWSLGWRSS